MTTTSLQLLLIEDSEEDAELLIRELRRGGYDPRYRRVDTPKATEEALREENWSIVVSDYSMPGFSALDALRIVKESGLDIPFIIVSGTIGEEVAVDAMRNGAHDYLMKGKLTRLTAAVERELRDAEERRRHRMADDALRKSEDQLRQSQKVEAIGRLAGGVAHDFNNLLTIIVGYCELLLARFPSDHSVRKEIEEIRKAGARAGALTRQLLAFSRRQILDPKVLDLNAIVGETEKMLKRLIGEDLDLRIITAPDLWRVEADPGQIEQVIMNLVINARDAMSGGGKLIIETANVVLDEAYVNRHMSMSAGPHVMLAVSDTGCGIDEETLAHVFEPFFTTKETGKGTGLGLSTVFGIVKQSGGNIWVYTEPGVGTTFKIYLPRVEAAVVTPRREAPKAPQPAGSETILLAEDAQELRDLVHGILAMRGYTVVAARNGAEALDACQGHRGPIQLLLTDVVMPHMSGRELARRLQPIRPEMKVLYMSGYTDAAIVHHGILEPGTAFLQKPFTPDSLLRKVREVLDCSEIRGRNDASLQGDLAPTGESGSR